MLALCSWAIFPGLAFSPNEITRSVIPIVVPDFHHRLIRSFFRVWKKKKKEGKNKNQLCLSLIPCGI